MSQPVYALGNIVKIKQGCSIQGGLYRENIQEMEQTSTSELKPVVADICGDGKFTAKIIWMTPRNSLAGVVQEAPPQYRLEATHPTRTYVVTETGGVVPVKIKHGELQPLTIVEDSAGRPNLYGSGTIAKLRTSQQFNHRGTNVSPPIGTRVLTDGQATTFTGGTHAALRPGNAHYNFKVCRDKTINYKWKSGTTSSENFEKA